MIRTALKNFYKNLKFFFVPLGTLFLAIAIALTIILPVMSGAVNELAGTLRSLLESAQVSVDEFKNLLTAELSKLPANLIDAVEYVLSTDWLRDTLDSFLAAFTENAGEQSDLVTSAADVFLDKATNCIAVFFWFCVLGLVAGYWLTKSMIRREIARRTFRQFLLAVLIDTALLVVFSFLSARLFVLWRPGGILAAAVSVLLFGFVSLWEAYLLRGQGRVRAKNVVNIRNILLLFAANFLVLLLAALLTSLAALLLGSGVALVVALPLMEIAVIVNSMTAESYVMEQIPGAK